MIKSLILYDEFGPGMGLPSMKESFHNVPYDGETAVIDYLKSGGQTNGVSMGKTYDFITGDEIEHERVHYSDDEYSWTSALIYYVENYNLRLSSEFEKHIKKKLKERDNGER